MNERDNKYRLGVFTKNEQHWVDYKHRRNGEKKKYFLRILERINKIIKCCDNI